HSRHHSRLDPGWLTPTSLHHNNNTLLEVKGEPGGSNTNSSAVPDVFSEALPPYTPAAAPSSDKHDLSASHLQQLYSSTMQAYGGTRICSQGAFITLCLTHSTPMEQTTSLVRRGV
ncbi:hypothetical protein Pmani_032437, partial [Petrolisthes manimaculis]